MVEIYKHQSKAFTYIVSSGHNMIGEIVEDDIMHILSAHEVRLFYGTKQHYLKSLKSHLTCR